MESIIGSVNEGDSLSHSMSSASYYLVKLVIEQRKEEKNKKNK